MTMRRIGMVISLLAIWLLWKIPIASAQTPFAEAGVEKFRVSVEAPNFTLTEVGGGKISLKELRGKIILLNFFASW
jgi:cytochrome oxidase Cu insertion factor (SCO1/SenC/PrrC family)